MCLAENVLARTESEQSQQDCEYINYFKWMRERCRRNKERGNDKTKLISCCHTVLQKIKCCLCKNLAQINFLQVLKIPECCLALILMELVNQQRRHKTGFKFRFNLLANFSTPTDL